MLDQTEQCMVGKVVVEPSRLEVLEGPTGRRRWPNEVKGRLVAESFQPGATVAGVALANGLRPQQLSGWRALARAGKLPLAEDLLPAFTDLAVEAEASSPSVVEILLGAVVIRLPAGASVAQIADIAARLNRTR